MTIIAVRLQTEKFCSYSSLAKYHVFVWNINEVPYIVILFIPEKIIPATAF